MSKSELTHLERVQLALDHKSTDRVPIAMVCAGIHQPTFGQMDEILKNERDTNIVNYLQSILDITYTGPSYTGPPASMEKDMWGVGRRPIKAGLGVYLEIDHYPLGQVKSIDDMKDYPWPTTDWFDYSTIPGKIDQINADEEHCIISGWGNVFETAWFMRGFEQAFMDIALEPEIINYIMEKVTDFMVDHHRKILEAGKGRVDLIFTADDIGQQQGLLMSLNSWEQNLKPHQKRLHSVIHEYGAKAIYHTDGSVMDAVPGLMDMGIDILQALQFETVGMDPVALKKLYGDRLCFEGGVSVQKTLPDGTVEEVIAETKERINVLAAGGGYILGPSHFIQAGTPAQNVLAMFDTAMETKL